MKNILKIFLIQWFNDWILSMITWSNNFISTDMRPFLFPYFLKMSETYGFLIFSGGIEIEHWTETR